MSFSGWFPFSKPLLVSSQGILAATHVGGLRALERHGLQYPKLGAGGQEWVPFRKKGGGGGDLFFTKEQSHQLGWMFFTKTIN